MARICCAYVSSSSSSKSKSVSCPTKVFVCVTAVEEFMGDDVIGVCLNLWIEGELSCTLSNLTSTVFSIPMMDGADDPRPVCVLASLIALCSC